MPSRNTRATPLPPDERRAEILAAAVPLVRQHGLAVSTRQIAEAAGVAEGTLFRVFRDKRALLQAAVDLALDPEPGIRRLGQIDRTAPLEERLTEALELLTEGMESTGQLFASLRATETSKVQVTISPRHSWEPMTAAVADLFEPDAHRLAVEPRQAARVLGTMLVTTVWRFPGHDDRRPFTTSEMVDIILYGVIGRQASGDADDRTNGGDPC